MESNESFDSAPRIKEEPSDVPIVENDGHSIDGIFDEFEIECKDEKLDAIITETLDPTNDESIGGEKVKKKLANTSSKRGKKKNKRKNKGKRKIVHRRKRCPVCGKSFTNWNLKKHINAHNPAVHSCGLCKKKYKNESNLKKHLDAKHNGRQYTCDICDKKFVTKTCVRVHIEGVHNFGVKHKCKQCKNVYKKRDALKNHVKSSHQGMRHKCHVCTKTYSYISSLRKHIKSKHIKKSRDTRGKNVQT